MSLNDILKQIDGLESTITSRISESDSKVRELDTRLLSLEQRGVRFSSTSSTSAFGRKLDNYSISKLIRYLADPKSSKEDIGFELECHQELAGKSSGPDIGIRVPFEVFSKLETKDITVGGTGSHIVPTVYQADNLIDVLRNRSIVMELGATVLSGLAGDVAIPKKSSNTTGYWFSGDGSDNITPSDPALGTVSLSPTFVGGLSGYSYKQLSQSSPSVERLIMDDLTDTLSLALDAAALSGSGTGNEPTGILNTVGIGTDTYSSTPTFSDIVGLEGTLAAANADEGNLGYATTPAVMTTLKTVDKGTDTGQFVWANSKMNGLPARYTNNMPAGNIIIGKWSDLLIGIWGQGIQLAVDPSTNFASGSVRVRAILGVDIAVRNAESFAEIHPV
ncbi:hypothetical protein A3197_19215 [Candidatus Thiodiazotropha endoloripes]|nr:hypothetical protein A3197_19215 [Candidatus Thiodiazotropha endoloripes]